VNNWGWGANDGGWGLSYFNECAAQGFIPAVSYYQMNGEDGGAEAQFLAKVQNASTMASYFGDFKILLQRAKEFSKPVMVMIEPDGYGFLEQQSAENPNTYAAVKDTGLAELSSLPNTVAGWGLAFLALRNSVGANNVRLGIHISAWASGKDVAYASVTEALEPEVNKVYDFLAPAGLSSNVTGATYDFLVGDPLDRDSDYYKVALGQDRWWDPSEDASIFSKSFNRYAEWLRLWNVKAGQRWVLWQIPLGNSNHSDVYNNGAPGEGYRDNRPEYFFGGDTRHLEKFADAGVIALLFGGGASGMSGFQNDTYSDGQLFMKSRAGTFLGAGALRLASSSLDGSGSGDASVDPSVGYQFEGDAQGWQASGSPITSVVNSTNRAADGTHALAIQFDGAAGSPSAFVAAPSIPAGATVSLKVWIPAGSAISAIQPFVLQDASGGWTWTSAWLPIESLRTNDWNTVALTLPSNATTPLFQLGVQFITNASWTGTAYVDAVTW